MNVKTGDRVTIPGLGNVEAEVIRVNHAHSAVHVWLVDDHTEAGWFASTEVRAA